MVASSRRVAPYLLVTALAVLLWPGRASAQDDPFFGSRGQVSIVGPIAPPAPQTALGSGRNVRDLARTTSGAATLRARSRPRGLRPQRALGPARPCGPAAAAVWLSEAG